jgi:hypothetical protein
MGFLSNLSLTNFVLGAAVSVILVLLLIVATHSKKDKSIR